MHTRHKARRGLRALVLASTVVVALVSIAGAPANAALTPRGASALDWLAHDLQQHGFTLPSSFDPASTDWGLTIDATLALAAGGKGTDATAQSTTTKVLDNVASYVTGTDFGSPNDRYAGPLGKALLLALIQGKGATHDGFDLEAELRARMQTSGDDAGRFSDKSDFGDFSNGLGQALDLLALDRTSGGVPAAGVTLLLAQQCPAGGFRLSYDTGASCTTDAQIDTDATSLALQALLAVPASTAVTSALDKGVTWLAGRQASTGSFAGSGPTATPNANSTGLAGAVLRASTHVVAANKAAAYVESLQLTSSKDAGAIAYNPAARDAAKNGIGSTAMDQFRRATAQGVLALGLPTYGQIGRVAPMDTHPGATASPTSVAPGGKVVVSGDGFLPAEKVTGTLHSTPVALGTETADTNGKATFSFTVPNDLAPGAHSVELAGETSGVTVTAAVEVTNATATEGTTGTTVATANVEGTASSAGELPRTGSSSPAVAGLALLAAGIVLVLATRRRSAVRKG
jgi:LPXTG-motif cell wall-anchored protein